MPEAQTRPTARRQDGQLTAAKAARLGLEQIEELTGKKPEGVTSVEPTDEGWTVGVEVIEDERIPSSTDMLAVYQAELNKAGDLQSCRRVRRYSRGSAENGEGDVR